MKYYSTTFKIQCDDEGLRQVARELLADSLGNCDYESFVDTEEGLEGYVQQELYHEQSVQQAVDELPLDGISVTFHTEEIPDQDWNEAWEAEGFEPIVIDGQMTIYDAHHVETAMQFDTPLQIGIQARNAFGTGTHETTRMIVSTILSMPLQGKRILDCGCGTGILALAALRCGAESAVGYDIDEFSSENAKHNAVLNGLGDKLEVLQGDANVLSHVDGVFDVVFANINRNILLADMDHFRNVMAHGATLILSGFYVEDAPMLLERAASLGLTEIARKTDNNWCCLVLH